MEELILQYKGGQLHHFHILIGDRDAIKRKIFDFCRNSLGCDTDSSLFFVQQDFDRFLIENSRSIVSRAIIKTEEGKKQIFCLSLNDITREAQNSLLKIIEEPPIETYFFLIAPRKDVFIPTIISRAVLIENIERNTGNLLKDLNSKSLNEKIEWADELAKKIKDGKVERGVARQSVKELINSLSFNLKEEGTVESLKTLQKVDRYLGNPGAPIKNLLEIAVLVI